VTDHCLGAPRSRQEYAQWRARQIAYGRWEPWALAAPVHGHVQSLRTNGASCRAIARAADVSPMTVHRLLNGDPAGCCAASRRMRAGEARRLLAVTPRAAARAGARRDATGTRLRLRALTATGYPAAGLAARAGVAPSTIRDLLSGHTRTVTPVLHRAVAALYDDLWDQPPPASTGAQRRAAAAALHRAAANGWPPPMGLDDDLIDDPGYRPRSHWRPTAAACVPRPKRPEPRPACGRARGGVPTHKACGR
jgi:lambda repressor-like predicted transcriptional regulator